MGYAWCIGTAIGSCDVLPFEDPHRLLPSRETWTNSALAVLDPNLQDGDYYITVRVESNVEYGGPLVTTLHHSTPYQVDTVPPEVADMTLEGYSADQNELSISYTAMYVFTCMCMRVYVLGLTAGLPELYSCTTGLYSCSAGLTLYNRPVQLFSRPVQWCNRPVQLFSRPVQLYNRPVQLFNRPVQLFSRPVQLFSRPLQLYNRSVQLCNRPVQLYNRSVQLFSRADFVQQACTVVQQACTVVQQACTVV